MILVTGPPGAGKTVLSASIIDSIRKFILVDPQYICAFFYCDKKIEHNQSIRTVLVSLMSQTLAQLENIPAFINTAYENAIRFGRSRISAADRPLTLLKELISSIKRVYIIIDGLDEFEDPTKVIEAAEELIECLQNVQIILLSRDDPQRMKRLGRYTRIPMTPADTSNDIARFISRAIGDLWLPDENLRRDIESQILHNASGMFLWAHLMIETLKQATSHREIADILGPMPMGLEVMYCAILKKLAQGPSSRQF